MKPSLLPRITLLVLLAALTGCSKTEPAVQPAAESPAKTEENVIALTKDNLAHASIQTEAVSPGSLAMTLKAVGRVSENLNKTAKVTSTLEGRLTQLKVDLNDRVKAGDVLGLVQSPELLGKPLELKAPIDGSITQRKSTVGELIGRDTEIYTISDPVDLWVLAEIKERDIGAIHVGQEAVFTVLAYPNETFRGKVLLLGNRVEKDSRTLEVRIEASNPDGRLKPGMFADVEVTTTMIEHVLVVPDTALQTDGEAQIVFIALGEGKFEKRVVKLGLEQHGRVQVLEGVKAGELVVTTGSFILKSELLKSQMEVD